MDAGIRWREFSESSADDEKDDDLRNAFKGSEWGTFSGFRNTSTRDASDEDFEKMFQGMAGMAAGLLQNMNLGGLMHAQEQQQHAHHQEPFFRNWKVPLQTEMQGKGASKGELSFMDAVEDITHQIFEKRKDTCRRILQGSLEIHRPEKIIECMGLISAKASKRLSPQECLPLIWNYLADNGHFEIITMHWERLKLKTPREWTRALTQARSEVWAFYSLIQPTWNSTNEGDDEYLEKFGEHLVPFYLELLKNPIFCSSDDFDPKDQLKVNLTCCLIGALTNYAHRCSEGSSRLRESHGILIIEPFLKFPIEQIRTLAFLMLCYISKGEDDQHFEGTDGQIIDAIGILRSCLADSNHVCRSEHNVTFNATEILNALTPLFASKSNSRKIIAAGALDCYAAVLQAGWNLEDQVAAINGLWKLSFEHKDEITARRDCMYGLRQLVTSPNALVSKAASGALWVLEDREKRELKSITRRTNGHIMISYNHGSKADVNKVASRLRELYDDIWIDVERMRGSTLECMARAIEDASVVLIFFSEQYARSPNCQSEADYCRKIQTPYIPIKMQRGYDPDGWLGLLIGTRLWYDLTKPSASEWEAVFKELCKGIEHARSTGQVLSVGQALPREIGAARASTRTSDPSPKPSSTCVCM